MVCQTHYSATHRARFFLADRLEQQDYWSQTFETVRASPEAMEMLGGSFRNKGFHLFAGNLVDEEKAKVSRVIGTRMQIPLS